MGTEFPRGAKIVNLVAKKCWHWADQAQYPSMTWVLVRHLPALEHQSSISLIRQVFKLGWLVEQ